MSHHQRSKKIRRFFTTQPLKESPEELWLEPSETHHVRDTLRLKPGETCLVTDGLGQEVEAEICDFARDGRTHLRIIHATAAQKPLPEDGLFLRVMPVLLRKGKTDFLVEKAQELGVHELRPVFSERCEVKIAEEKIGKIMERWQRIAREASKQSGCLRSLCLREPCGLKQAVESIPPEEPIVVFHPGEASISFPEWLSQMSRLKTIPKTLNVLIGPEGGFSEDEIRWIRWTRKEKGLWLVGLGDVLFKADTAFVGIVASLRFSGMLS